MWVVLQQPWPSSWWRSVMLYLWFNQLCQCFFDIFEVGQEGQAKVAVFNARSSTDATEHLLDGTRPRRSTLRDSLTEQMLGTWAKSEFFELSILETTESHPFEKDSSPIWWPDDGGVYSATTILWEVKRLIDRGTGQSGSVLAKQGN